MAIRSVFLQIIFTVVKNFLDCGITNSFACRFGAYINADHPDAFTANCNDVTSFTFLFNRGRIIFRLEYSLCPPFVHVFMWSDPTILWWHNKVTKNELCIAVIY